jgi:hypothetical protein
MPATYHLRPGENGRQADASRSRDRFRKMTRHRGFGFAATSGALVRRAQTGVNWHPNCGSSLIEGLKSAQARMSSLRRSEREARRHIRTMCSISPQPGHGKLKGNQPPPIPLAERVEGVLLLHSSLHSWIPAGFAAFCDNYPSNTSPHASQVCPAHKTQLLSMMQAQQARTPLKLGPAMSEHDDIPEIFTIR